MTKFLALLALAALAPFALAEDATKPAAQEKLAEAIATPLDKRTPEQKALIAAKIRADNIARFKKEEEQNAREMVTVHAEKVDLLKLLDGRLSDAEGKPVSIETIKKARYVAFYHSASWCCGCKTFTPMLMNKKYDPADIAIVFVTWDKAGKETQDYMHKAGFAWPSVNKGTFANSPARLAIRSIPHLRVYDASGALAVDTIGDDGKHANYTEVFATLDKLAAAKPTVK